MALIGNHSVLNKCPGRYFGGSTTSVEVQVRSNYNNSGSARNCFTMACSAESGYPDGLFSNISSAPNGYGMHSWLVPQKSGGMATNIYRLAGSSIVGNVIYSINSSSFVYTPNLVGGLSALASGDYTLSGSGIINLANANMGINASSQLSASGIITLASITGTLVAIAALTGSGRISNANFVASLYGFATLTGSGRINTANLLGSLSAIASLIGSGSIILPTITGKLETVASLSGSGNLTSIVLGVGFLTSILAGSSIISSAHLLAKGIVIASILGSGSITNIISAKGSLESSINVTGDLLTSATIADIIWGRVTEGSYTVEDLLKIIAAATGGKSSGGPNNPVFRNIADTVDRISGTADSSGNRTDVVYDVGD